MHSITTNIPSFEERQLPEFNAMQKVKRRFFAMRNGDLAQQMTERGANYRINFGLNLPQINEIAKDFLPGGKEWDNLNPNFDLADFARRLRDNSTTRESMLIAPMLFPIDQLSEKEGLEWALSVPTPEIADILCMKLLRNHPEADKLAGELLSYNDSSDVSLPKYVGLRLLLNLIQIGKITTDKAKRYLSNEGELSSPLTARLLSQLKEEISFLEEGI